MKSLQVFQIFGIVFAAAAFVWLIMQVDFSLHTANSECIQCNKLLEIVENVITAYKNEPVIYVITPTYGRPVQKAELTRMYQTLLLVPSIHWIIIEDSENKTNMVTNFLEKSGISFTHLNIATPEPFKSKNAKGVLQRNIAISWLRNNTDSKSEGVVYFADDDNTYDLELFEEMRYTKKVSVWPVALAGGLMVERPLVEDGKVAGWNAVYDRSRPFPIDMAGFAVNLNLLQRNPEAGFSYSVRSGFQESKLLQDLVIVDELEPKANNCTKVLVWHTRREYPRLDQERKLSVPTNLNIEV